MAVSPQMYAAAPNTTPAFTTSAKAPDTSRPIPPGLLFVVLGYLGVYGSWLVFHWGGHGNEAAIGDLVFVPLTLLAIGVAWITARRCAAEPRIASAWWLIGLALVFYCIGDVIQFAYETAGSFPAPSLADPFYLLFYPLFLAGLLRFPIARGTRHERARLLLDATTIAIGAGSVIWYVVLGPTAVESTSSLFTSLVASCYPVGDMVLIVGLTHVLLRAQTRGARRALSLLAAGIGLYVIADLVYGWLALHSSYSGGSGLDALWMTATALFAFAAASQATPSANPRPIELDDALVRADSPRLSALPYMAVAVVFGLFIKTQLGDSFFPGLSLTIAAVLVGALVSVRHYISQRDLLAVHLELGIAHAELATLATTDPLTGLPNHRVLVSTIDLELARAERYEHGCALLFFDIDHFKELNDSCGHAAGDLALHELGTLVNKTLRSIDTLGRWGGEEFVVVLPEIDAERAMAIAERVRKTIAAHVFEVAAGTHLTVSLGVASYPRDGTTRSRLLDAADRAMYAAKWLGRNQTFNASDVAVESIDTSKEDFHRRRDSLAWQTPSARP
jgi:diguanylate cyclase (GGDEF)-like protein